MCNFMFLFMALGASLLLGSIGRAAAPEPVQNETFPANMNEYPYEEMLPEPAFTEQERERGFMLFTRGLTAPVFPQSRPLASERAMSLKAWGARGQYVNLNICVYPLRDLKGLLVSDSGGTGTRELRHVAYWKIRYPYHNSGSFRQMPEFLFPHEVPLPAIPKGEPHRFLLIVKLPEDAPTGKLKGTLTIATADARTEIPYEIVVSSYKLKKDPNKHFSAYNYGVNRRYFSKGDPEEDMQRRQMAVKEFRRMADYGFTFPPFMGFFWYPMKDDTADVCAPDGKYIIHRFDEMLSEMKEAGLETPFIIIGGCCEYFLYEHFTKKKMGGHSTFEVPPPEEFYQRMEELLAGFLKEAKEKNYPRMIFAPVDEPAASSMQHVRRIHQIFKKHGCETYMTQPHPEDVVDDVVDYFCDQYYRTLPDVLHGKKKGYFCYPNFNSYEIKETATMTRGGRMVYGYGMWKSNYNCLIPWIWSCGSNKRIENSGGGVYITDEGDVAVPVYWECFREGIIDGMYVYTLSDAIIRREPAGNAELAALLKKGRETLQKVWDSVPDHALYLDNGHFADDEFDGARAEIAVILEKILEYPESSDQGAASIIVNPFNGIDMAKTLPPKDHNRVRWAGYGYPEMAVDYVQLFEEQEAQGNLDLRPIPGNEWAVNEAEASLEHPEENLFRFHIRIDHHKDGTGNIDKNLKGWPNLVTSFNGQAQNFNDYDFLVFRMRVNSNRSSNNLSWWPVSISFVTGKGPFGRGLFRTIEPDQWKTFVYPVSDLRDNLGIPADAIGSVTQMNFSLSENYYNHGDDLVIDFKDFALASAKKVVIKSLQVASSIESFRGNLPWRLSVAGKLPDGAQVEQILQDGAGRVIHRDIAPLEVKDCRSAMPLNAIEFAKQTSAQHPNANERNLVLCVNIKDKDGKLLASAQKNVTVVHID